MKQFLLFSLFITGHGQNTPKSLV